MDPTGAPVPGAEVVATNVATGLKYPTKSLDTGVYLIGGLPFGRYDLIIQPLASAAWPAPKLK